MLESQLRWRLSELLADPAPSLRFEVGTVIREEPPAAAAEPLRRPTEDDERRADELAAGVSRRGAAGPHQGGNPCSACGAVRDRFSTPGSGGSGGSLW